MNFLDQLAIAGIDDNGGTVSRCDQYAATGAKNSVLGEIKTVFQAVTVRMPVMLQLD